MFINPIKKSGRRNQASNGSPFFYGFSSAIGENYLSKAFEKEAMSINGFGFFIEDLIKKNGLEKLPGAAGLYK